jgi:hypothetical protein
VGEYLVELYLYRDGPDEMLRAATQARDGAERAREEGISVRYLGSLFIPSDETCFHVFDADSLLAVRDAIERGSIRFERIMAAVQLDSSELRRTRRAALETGQA